MSERTPELEAAIARVQKTFDVLTKARAKFNRCRRDDSREAAREEMVRAESAYREASDRRDELVQIDHARRTQSGDELGAHWSRCENGRDPAIADPAAALRERRVRAIARHLDELGMVGWKLFGREKNEEIARELVDALAKEGL